jgi:pyrroloquinoline quinone biosynthesis protein E
MGGPAFERIRKTLGWVRDAGINLHIKVTLIKQNIGDLKRLAQLLKVFEPALTNASEVMATGRGFSNYEAIQPSLEELGRAREDVGYCNDQGINISFRSHSLSFAEAGRPSTCTVGDTTATTCLIMPDGNMIPCTPAHVWGLANNVVHYGIQGAWERLPLYRQFLQADKLQGRCRSCEDVNECMGGCRAEAYLYTKDVWGEYSPCLRLEPLGKEA